MKNGKQKVEKGVLEKFLSHRMTAAEFSTLESKVFGTPNRQKFVFKNPTKAKLEEIEKLAKVMDIEPKELVQRTKAGFEKLTAKELLQIGFEFS
ncbi:hypothetical protein [Aureispira sp. CCB-E]|uniref:hypothetical protein n=1 Tax=Aureispira sp. CCB-E TaxID=3051121 RepID=UPI0028684755|nr:hypothetical protein [Aureispira sp. CCB-E]WMX17460.1 hypothetical protein QP953_13845 [Aureispira sp. CCB-E]